MVRSRMYSSNRSRRRPYLIRLWGKDEIFFSSVASWRYRMRVDNVDIGEFPSVC